jgi:NADH:ubiquinone oxidoreductase subunit F (NADH-binding)
MKYQFSLVINVDENALAAYNDRDGIQLDDDPTEWSEDNLALAIGEEVALIESIEGQVEA